MRAITPEQLTKILADHKEWITSDGKRGADANLAGADLARANLARAYLADANLAGADLVGADLARAYLARADLAGANLARAYLADANLAGADLVGAYLARAYLARANLAGAYLVGADLAGAYLVGANLADANLADANLARANLAGAYLADANLAGADLVDANLAGANLVGAYLTDANRSDEPKETYVRGAPIDYAAKARRFRERNPDVPVVDHLDRKILESIESGALHLDMGAWHTCETTHCRAGLAIVHAGEAGKALEAKVGPQFAGAKIYRASTGRVPHFFASNEDALRDIREQAAKDVES